MAPEPVWTGAKNLTLNGIRSPECPAHSESLYRLSYLGPSPLVPLTSQINPLKPKRRLFYLKTQSVPRCKHFSSRL